MSDIIGLTIYLGETLVGHLLLTEGEHSQFSFADSYLENPERPILSQSFLGQDGNVQIDQPVYQTQIQPFFSNLLPEGDLRDYLANKAGIKEMREFFLLHYMGQDLPGNIRALPLDADLLDQDFGTLQDTPPPHGAETNALRFSVAGVQLKFSAIKTGDRLTIPASGMGGNWLIKLPQFRFQNVPQNEFAMMQLAAKLGMNIPETRLMPMEEIENLPEDLGDLHGAAMVIKRFDRTDTGHRIHMEDMAQVFGIFPKEKYSRANYKNIAEVVWTLTGEKGIREYLRRLVYNILIANGDMHLKNWSLIYPDGKTAELAPGYDFLSTKPYIKNEKDMALNLWRGNGKIYTDIDLNAFAKFADKARLPQRLVKDSVTETIQLFMENWPGAKEEFAIEKRVAEAIETHLATLPLLKS